MSNKLILICLVGVLAPEIISGKEYCDPNQSCWPTETEIQEFKAKLSSPKDDCLPQVPTYSSAEEPGTKIKNEWFPEQPSTISPYDLMNLRNFIAGQKSHFVVVARSVDDVTHAVKFAVAHNLAINVISTGHEFQDRNSGFSQNAVLIRTTCLRSVEFELKSDNKFKHSDGFVKLGSGHTWGTSKFGLKGVQELAAENGRVVVSGHAAHVGIVGWSLGGGHGQLVPLHGLGVDQMLEVEIVTANGSVVIANDAETRMVSADGKETYSTIPNSDLFWALRGGGGSTWGVITSLTIKTHRPRNNCAKDCYTQRFKGWKGNFMTDDGEMATELLHTFFKWTTQTSKYWSSYGMLIPGENGEYYFLIGDALFIGTDKDDGGYTSLDDAFKDVYPGELAAEDVKKFNTFFEKMVAQDPETIFTDSPFFNLLSVFINDTTLQSHDVAKGFIDNWIPRCYRQGTPCVTSFLFHHTMAATYETDESQTAISSAFRRARVHVTVGDVISLVNPGISTAEKFEFIHDVVAPEMYKIGEGSYFSESEYTMSDWQSRLWSPDIYNRLVSVKKSWDPNNVFGCRHCIGDEEPACMS